MSNDSDRNEGLGEDRFTWPNWEEMSRTRHESLAFSMFEVRDAGQVVPCARCKGLGYWWVSDAKASLMDRFTGASVTQQTCTVCNGIGQVRV